MRYLLLALALWRCWPLATSSARVQRPRQWQPGPPGTGHHEAALRGVPPGQRSVVAVILVGGARAAMREVIHTDWRSRHEEP